MSNKRESREKGAFLLGIITATFVIAHELHLIYNVLFNGYIATAKVESESLKYAGYGSDKVSRYNYYIRVNDKDVLLADLENRHRIGEQIKVVCFKDKNLECIIAPKNNLNDMAIYIAIPFVPLALIFLLIAVFFYRSYKNLKLRDL